MPAWGAFSSILLAASNSLSQEKLPSAPASAFWEGFPREDSKLVSQVVGLSHFDEAGVKKLVTAHPSLVNACWDWGFGDWETPLGAASHVGERGIAEFLLEQGARIDIFAAAMLGMTEVVQAFVTARPGVQRKLGPHGIPLLAHAEAGGERATDTVAYLQSLGDAGKGYDVKELPAALSEALLGKFASAETGVLLECRLNKRRRLVTDIQSGQIKTNAQLIHYIGENEFYPSGVPSVRLKFTIDAMKAKSVTIHAKAVELTLHRVK